MKRFLAGAIPALAVFLAACGPPPSVAPPAPSAEALAKVARAESESGRGCYDGFKAAIEIYDALSADPSVAGRIALPRLRTLLLMIVRERELGILNNAYFEQGLAVIRDQPGLQPFLPLFEVAHSMTVQTKGVFRDFMAGFSPRSMDDAKKEAAFQADLKAKTAIEDFYAYLYAAFYIGGGGFGASRGELDPLVKAYPGSILMRYRDAIFPPGDEAKLQAFVAADPRFFEANYFLGDISLQKGKLLEAEKRFLAAGEGLTDSPQVHILLASIYFATEEFDKSLAYYDRTLALSPEYRDALLGKALCLSQQEKYRESIAELQRLIGLGFYLLGEGYYWLAWNEHALKENAAAQSHIEESKGRLPTNSEVFGLAGTIALDMGDADRAEREFLEALKYNPANTEALFGLGRIAAARTRWTESAGYLEKAAAVAGQAEASLAAKIEEIKAAELSPERKARLQAKKDQQLRLAQATRATAFLEAALSHWRAGNKARAEACAGRAAENPRFKTQAEDLLKKIKEAGKDGAARAGS